MKIIDNYRKLPIGKYNEIVKLCETEMDVVDRKVKIVGILSGLTDDEVLALFRVGIRIKRHVDPVYVTEYDECLLQAFAFLLQILQYVVMCDGFVGNGQGDSKNLLVTQLGAVLEILCER